VDDRAALVEREARESVLRVEAKNTAVLAYAREETDGLIQKVTLLEGELAEARWAREVAKENFRGLSNVVTDGAWQLVVTEREHREQFEELTILQTWGSELCLAIVGPARVRNHLSEGMRAAALRRTKRAGELAALRAVVSSAVEWVLGHSPDETLRVEVVGDLVAEF
jgi:hypothetical protein